MNHHTEGLRGLVVAGLLPLSTMAKSRAPGNPVPTARASLLSAGWFTAQPELRTCLMTPGQTGIHRWQRLVTAEGGGVQGSLLLLPQNSRPSSGFLVRITTGSLRALLYASTQSRWMGLNHSIGSVGPWVCSKGMSGCPLPAASFVGWEKV